MTRRLSVRPGAPHARDWHMRVAMPPPAALTAAGAAQGSCACDIAGVNIVRTGELALSHTLTGGGIYIIGVARVICEDTAWIFDVDWSGDPDAAPTVEEANGPGYPLWFVGHGGGDGVLTLSPSVECGGETLSLAELTITVVAE